MDYKSFKEDSTKESEEGVRKGAGFVNSNETWMTLAPDKSQIIQFQMRANNLDFYVEYPSTMLEIYFLK